MGECAWEARLLDKPNNVSSMSDNRIQINALLLRPASGYTVIPDLFALSWVFTQCDSKKHCQLRGVGHGLGRDGVSL